MAEKSCQTLRPIPIPDVNAIHEYSINCVKCERFWFPRATEVLMYEAFRRKGNAIEKVRICFECGTEKLRHRYLKEHEQNDYKNMNAWMETLVLISAFNCCNCGSSCDVNFRVTDGHIGKIPFKQFVFKKNHKFCYLCFENVKTQTADAEGRIILDPNQCIRNHSNDDEDSNVELLEKHFLK